MRPIVVLGGYGRLGRACVLELAAQTNAPLRVAGRNSQRAESLALSLGERAAPCYADAADPRILARALEGAAAVVACCGGDQLVALQSALELRVPFIGLSPLPLDPRSARHLGELAWRAQVPVVLHAGAVPGLPGILAESLVRRLPAIEKLRIASTGAFNETETARRDQRAAAEAAALPTVRRLPERWYFADPIGARALAPAACADLLGFAESHCVGALEYLEPPTRGLARSVAKLVARGAGAGFAVAARATPVGDGAAVEVELTAPDPIAVAAALAGALAAAILERRVPAGLSAPRDALGPAAALTALEKRGARIRIGGP